MEKDINLLKKVKRNPYSIVLNVDYLTLNDDDIFSLILDYYFYDDEISQTIKLAEVIIGVDDYFDLKFDDYLDERDYNSALFIMKQFGLNFIFKEKSKALEVENGGTNFDNTIVNGIYINTLDFIKKKNIDFNEDKELGHTKIKVRDWR